MSHYKSKSTRAASLEGQIAQALEKVPEPNRSYVAKELRRRRNKGNGPSTRLNVVYALRAFDKAVGHRDLLQCSPDELADGVGCLMDDVGQATTGTYMVHVRCLLKELHDVDALPRSLRSATSAPDVPSFRQGKVLADEEFHQILQYIQSKASHNGVFDRRPELCALAWVLRDAGTRARELLSLELSGVKLYPDGTGLLCLPTKPELQHMLKTGPRDIPIKDAVGPLRAWMDAHPASGNPDAPLFCGLRSRDGLARLGYNTFWRQVKEWGDQTGIDLKDCYDRTLRPHDFRHTCATMKVRVNRWQEQELCDFFGWSPGSKMPARYVHLDAESLRARVLSDAGINELGYRENVAESEEAKLLKMLKAYMQKV